MPKRSNVEQLPPELKAWLDEALVKNNFSRYSLLASELKARGATLGLEVDASRSGLHRYGSKLESRMAAIKAATEGAKLIAKTIPDDEADLSDAVMGMIQTDIFEAMIAFQEASAEQLDPGKRIELLSKAAKNIATLGRATVNQKKWRSEFRSKFAAEIGKVEAATKADKLTPEQVIDRIKAAYGISEGA